MAFGAEVAELIVALRLDDKGFTGKLNNAQRSLKGFGAGLSQMGKGAGQVGQGIDKIATRVAIAGAGLATFAVTTAASFEQAEAGIRKTVGGTTEEVDALIASIRQMARDVPLSFEELAAIAAEGGALGITTEGLDEFTDVVARLGVSTDLTTEQAATALGQLSNVLDLSETDLQQFGDALVALGNDGASTESQILDMAARFGAAGRAAGLTNEEILALSSTTASMGIEAEAGGGALSRIFNNLTLDMATASDEGMLLADTLGMSLDDLKKSWETDAGGVFQELLGYISELDQFEASQFLSELGITNTRDINAIRNLAAGFDEYGRQLGVAEGATNELNKESDVFFNTTEGRWKRLQNNVKDAAAVIGKEMLPVVNELAEEFMGWLNEPGTQQGLREFAENLAGGVRGLVQELKGADFGPLIDTLKGAAAIAKAGFDAFNALPSGIKSLALAAFGINKLTGGALGDIAKGFGNIFAGGLKLIFERGSSPANPLWVQTAGGGVGGAGGGAAGGIGLLGTAGIAAAILAGITVAATEVNKAANPTGFNFNQAAGGKGASRVQVEGDLLRLSQETGLSIKTLQQRAIPLLESGDRSWREVINQLRSGFSSSKATQERAVAAARDAVPWLQRNQQEVHNLNMSEGTRAANIMALSRIANGALGRTATASEITSRKRFDPKITTVNNITVPVNVAVNASIVQQQVYRLRQTTGSGGFI